MKETQASICAWADATFGPPLSDASIAARALHEMAELVTACVYGEPAEKIGDEAADVVIVLARLGRAMGIDVIQMLTFDPAKVSVTPLVCAAQATENLAITLGSLERGGSSRLGATIIWLMRLAAVLFVDLPAAIDAKMQVNRARKWHVDGRGHGEHVKDES